MSGRGPKKSHNGVIWKGREGKNPKIGSYDFLTPPSVYEEAQKYCGF
jgi:hypothetical protein